ncbi:hypothetical protein K461DRAFT_50359 [Myriangium duriaei CBS 260.36]|uniref:Nephrocystin 3-like N-terminal domain-containing protein n=1 Tax=Myriangium duriaei CBS 260.36 TaxID=1168546 RepID=A0A9P4ITW1_9PEZI|nr:hypothetical protein K461DRAFT_50359 [Myriangium duriaei CBS 260.36]
MRVILVDALDECENEDDISMIITLLMLLAQTSRASRLTLRIFVTSRPAIQVQHTFQVCTEDDLYRDVRLEYIQADTIKQDISLYLDHQLCKIRNEAHLPIDWPNADDIQSLVNLACPLFIFAATMCRYISERVVGGHPRRRLELLLQQHEDKTLVGLDQMYEAILQQVFPTSNTREYQDALKEFKELVSPIVLLANPLPLESLSTLLNLPSSGVFSTLQYFQSVLQIPTSPTDTSPIQPLHASFADYLQHPDRGDKKFHVDSSITHTRLAEMCLQRLSMDNHSASLKPNVCHLSKSGTRRTEVSMEQVKQHIGADIAYAHCYWAYHVLESANGQMLYDEGNVHRFLTRHLLHWVEAMAWPGHLSTLIRHINALQALSKVCYFCCLT